MRVETRPDPSVRLRDHGREQGLERAGLEVLRHGGSGRSIAGAAQRRRDPDRVVDPTRPRGRGSALNGGKPRQHLSDREAVPVEPALEQPPIAAGARAAPFGEPPRRPVGIGLLAGQRLEIVGQDLVDGRGSNGKPFEKLFHCWSVTNCRCSWEGLPSHAGASRWPEHFGLFRG
jgi:hypothetical protein